MYLSRQDTTSTTSLIEVNLPSGSYTLTWIDTKIAGEKVSSVTNHAGGWVLITSPAYIEDIALKVERDTGLLLR